MMRRLLVAPALASTLLLSACGGRTDPYATDGGDTNGNNDSGTGTGGLTYSNQITLVVEPSDDGSAFLNSLKGATKSIHMTMYLLTDNDVINALIARKAAGVDVRVVLNKVFPGSQGNSNASAFSKLTGASPAVPVVYSNTTFTYTHEKAAIVDGQTAWIMTMNATISAPTSNREYLVADTDPADVKEADQIFAADFAHTSITPDGPLLVAPTNAKERIQALLATATSTIDVEAEELSDSDIVDTLWHAASAGLRVRAIVSDETLTTAQQGAVNQLKNHGASVVKVSNPYIHAKAIVVDSARAYLGSANLTYNSLELNRELGIITENASVVSMVSSTINSDFSKGTAL